MLDPYLSDFLILESARRREEIKKYHKQCSHRCFICNEKFESGNKLHKHLELYPLHRVKYYNLSYKLECKKCGYITEEFWLNRTSKHIGIEDEDFYGNDKRIKKYRPCGGMMIPYIIKVDNNYSDRKQYLIDVKEFQKNYIE